MPKADKSVKGLKAVSSKHSVALAKSAATKAAAGKEAPERRAPAKAGASKGGLAKTEMSKSSVAKADAAKAPAAPSPAGPAAAAATLPVVNGKPRKNQAGLSAKELVHFRDLLLEKRREIVGDMSSMEREALRSGGSSNLSTLPVHMADMGTDNYEQEFTLGLVEKDRNLLREINSALAKMVDGSYGICEGTGNPIGKARLEVQPWARYSIEHARRLEKNGMGVRMWNVG